MGNLGRAYRDGRGVKRNLEKSAYFFKSAYEKKPSWGGELFDVLWDINTEESRKLMIDSAEKLAAMGDGDALGHLGKAYCFGRGVKQDISLAREYYYKSFKSGIMWSTRRLFDLLIDNNMTSDPCFKEVVECLAKDETCDSQIRAGFAFYNYFDGSERERYKELQSKAISLQKHFTRPFNQYIVAEFYPEAITDWFNLVMGGKHDLSHPTTFNEKIQWLKINDSTELKTIMADKYLMRAKAKTMLGGKDYTVPLLGVYDSFDEIDFSTLPDKFVLKANHGSGYNEIITDKQKINRSLLKKKFDNWLNLDYAFEYGFELHYHNIPRKIIAEEYMENHGESLIDYRFFCFNGVPKMVWVDQYSGTDQHIREIFDIGFNKLPVRCKWPTSNGKLCSKPTSYDEMLQVSKTLSKDFIFVRIDFFEINSKMYLSELTFTPMSGTGKFSPPEYDYIFGKMMELPANE